MKWEGPLFGSEKLMRFEDQSYCEKFLGLLSSVLAIEVASLDGDTEESQIKRIAGQITDKELQNTVVSSYFTLEDNRIQAQDLIDLHLGTATEEERWEAEDFKN